MGFRMFKNLEPKNVRSYLVPIHERLLGNTT